MLYVILWLLLESDH